MKSIIFFLLAIALVSCGKYPDGTSVYSDGVWILFILAGALTINGLRVFYISSRKGSYIPATDTTPKQDLPSLPWWKSVWGWTCTLTGIIGAIVVIVVQNTSK